VIPWHRSGPALCCVMSATAWPATAAADVKPCLNAAEEGQRLRDSGAYLDARQRFIACAADECPGEVRKACVGWLGDLDKLIPTVVFGARLQGREIADVRVSVDGKLVAERIDGKPVALDPGERHIRFEHTGEPDVDETTVVMAGEKERPVTAQFGGDLPALPPSPTAAVAVESHAAPAVAHAERSRAPAYALGALGLGALAAGAVLDISGYAFLQQCGGDSTCKGAHERAEVQWRFVTGDALLGVGALSGVAAWLLWPRGARDGSHPVAVVGADPSTGRAVVGLAGTF
jgi:hypothetical protein